MVGQDAPTTRVDVKQPLSFQSVLQAPEFVPVVQS